jgi:two-component system OmpR family response regulator
LSTTEYELLEYLAQQRDRLVSKRELSREVWGQDFDPTSNVIAVYIARLRKKIDGGRSRPLIRSRRGEGYALSAATASELDDTPE